MKTTSPYYLKKTCFKTIYYKKSINTIDAKIKKAKRLKKPKNINNISLIQPDE
jgi:hypothetical protein